MAKTTRKRMTGQTGERPVIQCRVHEDVYAELKKSAERRKLSISEEIARCIGQTQALDRQQITQEKMMKLGAEEFLRGSGYTKVREADGTHLWVKGEAAIAKWTALNPDFETAIERAVLRAMEKANSK